MIRELWVGGRLVERWDDDKRKRTAFDGNGRVTNRRGFNNAEKAAAATRLHPLRDYIAQLKERMTHGKLP